MNLPANQTAQLPAHLQALKNNAALSNLNAAASAGISAGGWPRISIKASRFRLQSPQGEEVVVQEHYLDIVVVDANPHGLQKIYYAGVYDPNTDEKAPDCYSDNGIGPSQRVSRPQCGTCAACPNNIWGSKIMPSGKQGKACADVKKTAVLIANNPSGPVFEFRIPPASLSNWMAYVESLNNRGVPASCVVTRLSFDTAADFPKLIFQAIGYSNEEQATAVLEVIGTDEVDQCTGKNDKPIDPSRLLAAPQPAAQSVAPQLPAAQPAFVAAAPASLAQPLPKFLQNRPMPEAPLAAASPVAEAPKRRGRGKAAAVPEVPPVPTGQQAPFNFAVGHTPAASVSSAAQVAVPINVPTTNATLDAMLAEAMKA